MSENYVGLLHIRLYFFLLLVSYRAAGHESIQCSYIYFASNITIPTPIPQNNYITVGYILQQLEVTQKHLPRLNQFSYLIF